MGSWHRKWSVCVSAFALLGCVLGTSAWGQGLPLFPPQTAPSISPVDGRLPRLVPVNPLGLPGSAYLGDRGSDVVPLSSGLFRGLLPEFPNLDLGFDLEWWSKSVSDEAGTKGDEGNRLYARRLFLDYRPSLSVDAYHNLFLEIHG